MCVANCFDELSQLRKKYQSIAQSKFYANNKKIAFFFLSMIVSNYSLTRSIPFPRASQL